MKATVTCSPTLSSSTLSAGAPPGVLLRPRPAHRGSVVPLPVQSLSAPRPRYANVISTNHSPVVLGQLSSSSGAKSAFGRPSHGDFLLQPPFIETDFTVPLTVDVGISRDASAVSRDQLNKVQSGSSSSNYRVLPPPSVSRQVMAHAHSHTQPSSGAVSAALSDTRSRGLPTVTDISRHHHGHSSAQAMMWQQQTKPHQVMSYGLSGAVSHLGSVPQPAAGAKHKSGKVIVTRPVPQIASGSGLHHAVAAHQHQTQQQSVLRPALERLAVVANSAHNSAASHAYRPSSSSLLASKPAQVASAKEYAPKPRQPPPSHHMVASPVSSYRVIQPKQTIPAAAAAGSFKNSAAYGSHVFTTAATTSLKSVQIKSEMPSSPVSHYESSRPLSVPVSVISQHHHHHHQQQQQQQQQLHAVVHSRKPPALASVSLPPNPAHALGSAAKWQKISVSVNNSTITNQLAQVPAAAHVSPKPLPPPPPLTYGPASIMRSSSVVTYGGLMSGGSVHLGLSSVSPLPSSQLLSSSSSDSAAMPLDCSRKRYESLYLKPSPAAMTSSMSGGSSSDMNDCVLNLTMSAKSSSSSSSTTTTKYSSSSSSLLAVDSYGIQSEVIDLSAGDHSSSSSSASRLQAARGHSTSTASAAAAPVEGRNYRYSSSSLQDLSKPAVKFPTGEPVSSARVEDVKMELLAAERVVKSRISQPEDYKVAPKVVESSSVVLAEKKKNVEVKESSPVDVTAVVTAEESSGLSASDLVKAEGETETYEEVEFVWDDYIEETKTTAAPATAFKHVEYSLQSGFVKGMLVEVANRSPADTYWVAAIIVPCGQLLQLRPVGCHDDASHDFWSDVSSSDIHPLGFCRDHQLTVCPPDELACKLDNWQLSLEKSLIGASTPPSYMLDPQTGTLPIDQIKEGMYVEAQLETNPQHVWLAKVIENVGGRLLLRYDLPSSWQTNSNADFWLFYLHHRLHPIGWAQSRDCSYRPPDAVVSELGLQESDWKEHLDSAISTLQQPPPEIFQDQMELVEHRFIVGWKLEAFHPGLMSVIRPATVTKVFNKFYFYVELDDLDLDTKSSSKSSWGICCHALSLNIFPVGWCSANGFTLTPVPGYEKAEFLWEEYLSKCQAEAAPDSVFYKHEAKIVEDDDGSHEFEANMKLEAVNPSQSGQICAATIVRVYADRILQLQLDHLVSGSVPAGNATVAKFLCTVDSFDIFPIGWAESNEYQLKAPVIRRRVVVGAKSASSPRKVAVVQPECHSVVDERTALYQQMKEAIGRSSNWCPKIFFNYRCFTGPYLSKGRLVLLPRFVGPGPVVLVLREVLSMMINVAYKPSRVLRELQLHGLANPNMTQQLLNAKCKNKSYSATVEICKSGDQVNDFCRQVCLRLQCCPNLISPLCVPATETCPDDCSHLSKTKFTNYFGKKRKLGRPPGGHTNLVNAKKKNGRRRKHRKNALTIRKKHSTTNRPAQDSSADAANSDAPTENLVVEPNASETTANGQHRERIVTKIPLIKIIRPCAESNARKRAAPAAEEFPTMIRSKRVRASSMPRYSFERRTHRKVLHVLTPDGSDDVQHGCEVSPCQVFREEAMLKLDSNPLHWTANEVVEFLKTTDCKSVCRFLREQEIDGQSLMMLTLPTIQEYLDLKLGPAVKLCHQIEQIKIAFFRQFASLV